MLIENMRILFINTTFDIGSTGKLVNSFARYAYSMGLDIAVISANRDESSCVKQIRLKGFFSRKVTIFLERLTGLNEFFSPFSTLRAISFIKRYKPDVVYLGNLHGYYINTSMLYNSLSKLNIPCVQMMWDEYSMTGSCSFSYECTKYKSRCRKCDRLRDYPMSVLFDNAGYMQNKKEIYYRKNDIVFVSVPYIIEKAKGSHLLSSKVLFELDEAVDQKNIFFPRDISGIKRQLHVKNEDIVILNVCVYPNRRKGGEYYISLAKNMEHMQGFVFVHIGFNGDRSICPSNYIALGYEDNQNKLAEYYSLADIFVCTSLAETQPNTCLEALSCGTPICGFNISGIPTCAEAPYGHYVEVGDIEALMEYVMSVKKKTRDSILSVRKYAESRFSSDLYNNRLLNIGQQRVKKKW